MSIRLDAHVDEKEALKYLGYKGQGLSQEFMSTFRSISSKVNKLKAISVRRAFSIERTGHDHVLLAGTSLKLSGSHIVRHLRDATEVELVAITLGYASQRLIKQISCTSVTEGMIANACASSMAENAIELLYHQVSTEAASRNMKAGRRFSPGYGNFPLSIQREFIAAIDADRELGIRVTDGNLMVPTKSITAVIPLVPNDHRM